MGMGRGSMNMAGRPQMSPATYTVQRGDTLSAIASNTNARLNDLVAFNHLKNADRLEVGQILKLQPEKDDLSFQVLLLDALRYPMEGITYMLMHDGQQVQATTGSDGLGPVIQTASPQSLVEVWVQRIDKSWKRLGQTLSGMGYKRVTLVSPNIAFTEPAKKLTEADRKHAKPAYTKDKPPGPALGEPIRPGHIVRTRQGDSPATVVLELDIPQALIDYFKLYKGGTITDQEWTKYSRNLQCDVDVLKAFAEVESGGREAFWRLREEGDLHVPMILFERHYFHRLHCANGPKPNRAGEPQRHGFDHEGHRVKGCNSAYDKDPDISWPVEFRQIKYKGAVDQRMRDGYVSESDVYKARAVNYQRLIKAYRLNPSSALQSASWGKFQIMGANYLQCGVRSIESFVKAMCANEAGQLELVAEFIRGDSRLHEAIQRKDWESIARHYNGPDYKKYNYDKRMEIAYRNFKISREST
jgi:LysM repeat protein